LSGYFKLGNVTHIFGWLVSKKALFLRVLFLLMPFSEESISVLY
jgi:hypothetical protein